VFREWAEDRLQPVDSTPKLTNLDADIKLGLRLLAEFRRLDKKPLHGLLVRTVLMAMFDKEYESFADFEEKERK
jgi:hypothetical protein